MHDITSWSRDRKCLWTLPVAQFGLMFSTVTHSNIQSSVPPPDPPSVPQVYAGLRYRLSLDFPSGYPYQAPCVKFVTPCFHPNVDDQGFICMDILKDKWSALYDVRSILLSIQSLLGGGFRVVTDFCLVSVEPLFFFVR